MIYVVLVYIKTAKNLHWQSGLNLSACSGLELRQKKYITEQPPCSTHFKTGVFVMDFSFDY